MIETTSIHEPSFELVKRLMRNLRMLFWTWDLTTGQTIWDDDIWQWLGRPVGEPTIEVFMDWIHPLDRPMLAEVLNNHLEKGTPYQVPIRMLHADGSYRWYETSGQAQRGQDGKPFFMTGVLRDVHEATLNAEALATQTELLEHTGELAHVGGWRVDLVPEQKVQWTAELHRIHELPPDSPLDVDRGIDFYVPEHQPLITEAFERAVKFQEPYSLQLQIVTQKGNRKWVQTAGKAVVREGKVVAVQGVFQDIDLQKKQQLKVEESLAIISEQNKRLHNFAHVVSHNLRSHAATLKSLLELRKMSEDSIDDVFYDESLHKISDALSNTISELNDVVQIQSQPVLQRKLLLFEDVYNDALTALGGQLRKTKVHITPHFGGCPTIKYNPAYLDSIVLNLLSNAIKYRKPDGQAEVSIRSFLHKGRPVLEVKDNGQGMDMSTMGHKLFGMYQTFHGNEDAKGIGLYLVQSQVEALGGHIEVQSWPNDGTTFTVYF